MRVTIEIDPGDIERVKLYLANQAQLRQMSGKVTTDPKETRQFQVEAEFCRSVYNLICDIQTWELHEARRKVAV